LKLLYKTFILLYNDGSEVIQMEMINATELAKTAYETESVVNFQTPYGEYILMSVEDYRYFLDMMETRAVEKDPELNRKLLDGLKADRSEFISEEEIWDV